MFLWDLQLGFALTQMTAKTNVHVSRYMLWHSIIVGSISSHQITWWGPVGPSFQQIMQDKIWCKFQVHKATKAGTSFSRGECFLSIFSLHVADCCGSDGSRGWSTLPTYNNVAATFRTSILFHVLVLWLYHIKDHGELTAYLCISLLFLCCFIYCVCSCT